MNKPEYVHGELVYLTRSMSPRTKREFNNVPLITQEEIAKELARKQLKIANIDMLYFSHLLDSKLKEWGNKYLQ